MQNCQEKLKKLLAKYKELADIFVFGSIVKGKNNPQDIDVALFFKDKMPKELINSIKKEIKAIIDEEIDIEVLDVYSQLWLVIAGEGFSVNKNRFMHEFYKVKPVVLYNYSLKKLNSTQKVQFTRGLNEMINSTEGIKLTRSVVLIPLKNKIKFDEFLNSWSMMYETKSFELMPVLRKEELY